MKPYVHLLAATLALLAFGVAAEERLCGTQYLAQQRDGLPLPRLSAVQPPGVEIEVGTQLNFLVAGDLFLRPATCRYVGEYSYIFVDDGEWGTQGSGVTQADVDTLAELFERSTPADPERGMYELMVETFGTPPDVDGDERIFIVVVNTRDSRLIGFFDPRVATWPDPALRRDAIHLSAAALRNRPYLARGTLAHEFQHLIHWGYDPNEETWINEGLSGYAEALVGFPETDPTMVDDFLNQPDLNLTAWPVQVRAAHYGATYLFVAFLAERYGPEFIRNLVAEPLKGIAGIDAAFQKSGWVQDFAGAWEQWIVANYAADDPLYGYGALNGRRVKAFSPLHHLPFTQLEGMVGQQWGTLNLLFRFAADRPGNLVIDFAGEVAARFSVWGYAMRGGAGRVTPIEFDSAVEGRLEVEQVDSLALIVGRTSPGGRSFWVSADEFSSTAVAGAPASHRERLMLAAVYPNPFNRYVWIPFTLPATTYLQLSLYNYLGQRIRSLGQGLYAAGQYEVSWDILDDDGNEVSSGPYLVVLQAGEERRVQRLSLIK